MNLEALRLRLAETTNQMRALVTQYEESDDDFSDEDQTRYDELAASARADKERVERLETRFAELNEFSTTNERDGDRGGLQVRVPESPYNLDDIRLDTSAHDIRQHAITAIEQDEVLPDERKEQAVQTLQNVDVRGEIATLILATGNPNYRSAFTKLIAGAEWALTDDERRAVTRAQAVANATGGFAVPFTLDPTIMWTNDGAINPMRQLADLKRTTTGDWNGVTSAGATANWRGEAVESTDDAIALGQPSVPVHKMDIFVPYSVEIEMEWQGMENDLRSAMADAKDRLEAVAHFNGTGTLQPTGIITALDGSASEVAPATAEVFAGEDVYNLRRLLPARHRSSREMVNWVANLGTYDAIRQFDTAGGGDFWTDMMNGTPDRLLSYDAHESSAMDDAADINIAATADNHVLLVGNFKRFVIVDQIGLRIENIPHLFGANNRPTGQRGLYAIARTGSDVVDINAFRLLNVATTA